MKEANCSFFYQIICAFRKEGFARLKGMESKMKRIKKLTALALSLLMVATILMTVHGDNDADDTISSWAIECVNRAVGLNLVPQNLQSNFTQPITRAEFTALAVYLYQTLGSEITGRVTFADTNDIYVEKAAYIGIVSGVGGNRFDPDATLTREQAAVLLSRLADAIGHSLRGAPLVFADSAKISLWAVSGVEGVVAHGIMAGTGNYMFSPLQPYTREQSIITILRVFELEVNEPNLPEPRPLETSVRVAIYVPDLAFPTALEYIYSDEYYRYYLSAIMSGSIILTFEDGVEVTLREALDQQLITIIDLELNGLNLIKMPALQRHD